MADKEIKLKLTLDDKQVEATLSELPKELLRLVISQERAFQVPLILLLKG